MAPISCIRPLLVMIYIYSLYDASLVVRVGKYTVIPDRGIGIQYVPTISFKANSLIICARGFHSREDACYASYHGDICKIYTTGCCPQSHVLKEGYLLLQRDLKGKLFIPIQTILTQIHSPKPKVKFKTQGQI